MNYEACAREIWKSTSGYTPLRAERLESLVAILRKHFGESELRAAAEWADGFIEKLKGGVAHYSEYDLRMHAGLKQRLSSLPATVSDTTKLREAIEALRGWAMYAKSYCDGDLLAEFDKVMTLSTNALTGSDYPVGELHCGKMPATVSERERKLEAALRRAFDHIEQSGGWFSFKPLMTELSEALKK